MSGFWDETQLVGVSAISGDSGALLLTDSCRFPLGAVAFPHLSAKCSDSGLCKTLACAKCGCRESRRWGFTPDTFCPTAVTSMPGMGAWK